MIIDLLVTLAELVSQLWIEGKRILLIACISGITLGALSWWLCHLTALSINQQFPFRLKHHILCAMAAFTTLVFTVLFFAFHYTGQVAEGFVAVWEATIRLDDEWNRNTYIKAYEAVYNLQDASGNQLEDFKGKPHPSTNQDTLIPTTYETSKLVAAKTYAEAAVDYFKDQHPLLSKILWARSDTARKGIVEDMKRVFDQNPGATYKAQDAIRIAAEKIRKNLKKQVPRVVFTSRILLAIAFIFVQAMAFGLMIRAALKDIKEDFSQQPYKGQ